MSKTSVSKRSSVIRTVLVGFVIILLAVGITHAAMRSIQLNSSATFPVDI